MPKPLQWACFKWRCICKHWIWRLLCLMKTNRSSFFLLLFFCCRWHHTKEHGKTADSSRVQITRLPLTVGIPCIQFRQLQRSRFTGYRVFPRTPCIQWILIVGADETRHTSQFDYARSRDFHRSRDSWRGRRPSCLLFPILFNTQAHIVRSSRSIQTKIIYSASVNRPRNKALQVFGIGSLISLISRWVQVLI